LRRPPSPETDFFVEAVRLCQPDLRHHPEIAPLVEAFPQFPWNYHGKNIRPLATGLLLGSDDLHERIATAETLVETVPDVRLRKELAKVWLSLVTHGMSQRRKQPEETAANVNAVVEAAWRFPHGPIAKEAQRWLRYTKGRNPHLATPELEAFLARE